MKRSALCLGVFLAAAAWAPGADEPLFPGARPLEIAGDPAGLMVDGIDRFLTRETERAAAARAGLWKRDGFEANRRRLAYILGVRDDRTPPERRRLLVDRLAPAWQTADQRKQQGCEAVSIAWPAFGGVQGEGLALLSGAAGALIVIPDADSTPEQLAGFAPGPPIALRLARRGFDVYVPALLDRRLKPRRGRARLSDREFIHRAAFELGRTTLGYEIEEVLALVDVIKAAAPGRPVGVFGHGEGGLIALYAAALDPRIAAVCVSAAFGDRDRTWSEPLERNMFGLLERFGAAETALLIAPRPLVIEAAAGPEVVIPAGLGAAPGRLTTPGLKSVRAEVERARSLAAGLGLKDALALVESGPDGAGPPGSDAALTALSHALNPAATPAAAPEAVATATAPELDHYAQARRERLLHALDQHTQTLLAQSAAVRARHFAAVDKSSLKAYAQTIEPYRREFATEVVGRFEIPLSPPNPRIRKILDEPRYTGWEVMLDVFPDVFAYGILLVPKGLKPGEKRPVVVCQHGLEGRPRDVADPKIDNPAYHAFGARLAERGCVVFAPQNPYIFEDRFRMLQRKANPIQKTLFSIIVPQHQRITDYLAGLAFVDPARIAFYGLSYGGKTAMRVPALVSNYSLSICSADFNEWVWKNASTESPYSYVWSGEYEIFEWNLGNTFNYAEMAALIAPRPFMVERGRFDGVAPDEMVAHEFAKVAHLYAADLKIGDRARIEFFIGPHTINGKGTFAFLTEFLGFPTGK